MAEPSSGIPYFFNVWAIPYWFTFLISFTLFAVKRVEFISWISEEDHDRLEREVIKDNK